MSTKPSRGGALGGGPLPHRILARILLIDDDELMLEFLRACNCATFFADNGMIGIDLTKIANDFLLSLNIDVADKIITLFRRDSDIVETLIMTQDDTPGTDCGAFSNIYLFLNRTLE